MNIQIYSIYDKTAKSYSQPFYAANDDCAVRILVGSFDERSQLVLYPSDYVLCHLGSFDDTSGLITSDEVKTVSRVSWLIPDKLKSFARDGTFERGE